jgi:hypothetical protein
VPACAASSIAEKWICFVALAAEWNVRLKPEMEKNTINLLL